MTMGSPRYTQSNGTLFVSFERNFFYFCYCPPTQTVDYQQPEEPDKHLK